jgi:hypothetical protein
VAFWIPIRLEQQRTVLERGAPISNVIEYTDPQETGKRAEGRNTVIVARAGKDRYCINRTICALRSDRRASWLDFYFTMSVTFYRAKLRSWFRST